MDLVFMDFVRVLVYEHAKKKENFANIQGMRDSFCLTQWRLWWWTWPLAYLFIQLEIFAILY